MLMRVVLVVAVLMLIAWLIGRVLMLARKGRR